MSGIIAPKKLRMIGGAVVLIFVLAFIAYIASPLARNHIPDEFDQSRQLSASIANGIVGMVQESTGNLKAVRDAEHEGEGLKALDAVLAATQQTRQISDKASDLARELEKMANQIVSISPDKAAQTALVAISSETALLNQVLVYNGNLNKLLFMLRERFIQGTVTLDEVNKVIEELNATADSINNLNVQYRQLMESFDQYYK